MNTNSEYLGKGIGTAGIWLGVGLIGAFDHTGVVGLVALFAFFATLVVWCR